MAMEPTADEIKRLQGCINDLISVLALPAIWSGHEPSQIVSTLLDVLLRMLRLDFAYVSETINGSLIEVLRVAQRRNLTAQPQEVGRALTRWLTSAPPTSPLMVPNPVGEGEVSIVRLRLGLQDDVGFLVAGSQRADFPTEIERLLLRVAANQAAIALQEARRLSEQRRAAEEIRFQAGLLDAVDQAVITTDTEGIITYWNRFAGRLYGWSAPEVIGRNILDVTRAQGSPRAAAEMRSRWQRGERWTGECLVQHRDGRSFPILVTDSPIYNSQEVLIGVVRISLDIIERKRTEEELEQRVVERTRQLTAVNEELRKEIIERKRAEEEREQVLTREQAARAEAVAAQHRFRDLVNSIEGIVWEADAQTFQFLFVSQQAQRVLGYPVERWLNEPTFWKDHIHPDDRAWAVEFCVAATAEQRDHEFEYRMLAADGRSVWLRDLVTVVAEGDRGTKLLGVMVDITARKRAEAALREQASLLDLTHDTVFVRDMNDVITYWNRGAEELYGWKKEAAIGQVSHQLTQTIFPAPLAEINAEFLRTGRWEGELRHTKRDGTQVVVASRWSLQRDEQGNPMAILETNNDITERKRAEQALTLFRSLIDHTNDTIEVIDPETGRFLDVNEQACRAHGYTREEYLALTVPEIDPLIGARPWEETMEEVRRSGSLIFESQHRRKDGSGFPVEVNANYIRLDRDYHVAVIRDITERKRAEEALRQTQAELAHVTRVMTMGALTASIAHEVNQPLAAVVTNGNACLRWLAREVPDLEEARAAVERIIKEGNRASEVLRRIRALAQKANPQKAWLDLNDVIREVVALMYGEVRQQRVALRTDLAAALPPVLGDRVQLQQVILNLMINGIEAMQAVADRPRELRIRSQRHDADTVLVAVQDAGIGLDPQQMVRLFDAFFTTKPGGMGMGLAICRTIIEAHGGRLWASPNDSPGATFQFTLPAGGAHVS
jgi:PAS domain S-box-containing protein